MIDLTPLEVRKKKGEFKRAMRGYEPALVDDFLDLVADRMEELVRENLTLAERATRNEQQVAEYRDRERALTEALVTAQEMREEVRRQATREAELSLKTAHQEAAQLRTSAEQESTQLRSEAEQAAAQLRAAAERDAARVRAEAELESAQLRSAAQQEAAELRAAALKLREREEGAAEGLRARQQQVLTTYRTFLERELAELRAVARSLGVAAGDDDEAGAAAGRRDPHSAAAPAAPPLSASVGGFAAGVMVSHALAPEPADEMDDVDVFNEPDLDDALADAGIESDLADAEDDPSEVDLVLLDDDLPPFEPEPVVPEDDGLELYDAVAEPEPDAGVPGAIGLGEIPAAGSWSTPAEWKVPGIDLVPDGAAAAPSDEDGDDADDEETSQLLRNAAAAGYRLPDEDELLLDEAVDGEDEDEDEDAATDGGWLPGLLDDDRDDRFDA